MRSNVALKVFAMDLVSRFAISMMLSRKLLIAVVSTTCVGIGLSSGNRDRSISHSFDRYGTPRVGEISDCSSS